MGYKAGRELEFGRTELPRAREIMRDIESEGRREAET